MGETHTRAHPGAHRRAGYAVLPGMFSCVVFSSVSDFSPLIEADAIVAAKGCVSRGRDDLPLEGLESSGLMFPLSWSMAGSFG